MPSHLPSVRVMSKRETKEIRREDIWCITLKTANAWQLVDSNRKISNSNLFVSEFVLSLPKKVFWKVLDRMLSAKPQIQEEQCTLLQNCRVESCGLREGFCSLGNPAVEFLLPSLCAEAACRQIWSGWWLELLSNEAMFLWKKCIALLDLGVEVMARVEEALFTSIRKWSVRWRGCLVLCRL